MESTAGKMDGHIKEILITTSEMALVNFMINQENLFIEDFGKMENKVNVKRDYSKKKNQECEVSNSRETTIQTKGRNPMIATSMIAEAGQVPEETELI
jgi:hypothetical protein